MAACALLDQHRSFLASRLAVPEAVYDALGRKLLDAALFALGKARAVSIPGAFVLAQDLEELAAAAARVSAATGAAFQNLREVTSLFMIPPDAVGELLDDGVAGLTRAQLQALVMKRPDFREGWSG